MTVTLTDASAHTVDLNTIVEVTFDADILNNGSLLPVELTTFSASIFGSRVKLYWTTATEVDNYGFEVQRKELKNIVWENIGFIQGHGNSNSPKSYSFTDANAPAGNVGYRLKQIDFDGRFDYSDIVDVSVGKPTLFSVNQNYPNPFNPTTEISYSLPKVSNVTLKVYNTLGQVVATLVNERQEAGRHIVEFNGTKLSSGIYFYSIRTEENVSVKKMILLR